LMLDFAQSRYKPAKMGPIYGGWDQSQPAR
jgi:hypothetical protein